MKMTKDIPLSMNINITLRHTININIPVRTYPEKYANLV